MVLSINVYVMQCCALSVQQVIGLEIGMTGFVGDMKSNENDGSAS
jgi:hypothetical protein